jgi:hypothetical protein
LILKNKSTLKISVQKGEPWKDLPIRFTKKYKDTPKQNGENYRIEK